MTTGDSIILSKNHGIVKFPVVTGGYFRLYGIEGNMSVGERLAGFKDFFNFNVGDSFVYSIHYYYPEPPMDYSNMKRWHYLLTGKTVLPDGFQYSREGFNCIEVMACINPVNFSNNISFYESQYNNQCSIEYGFLTNHSYGLTSPNNYCDWDYFYFSQRRYKMNDTTFVESIPYAMCTLYSSSPGYHSDILVTFNPTPYCMWYDDFSACYQFYAREGVGVTYSNYSYFENAHIKSLLFCRIGNDTLYNHLVGSENTESQKNEPKVFPSPASNRISITGANEYNTATIYSTSGKKVKEIILSGDQTEAHVSDMKPGMYFVILEGKGKRATLKFVVESGN
jgi:hypothetical protein